LQTGQLEPFCLQKHIEVMDLAEMQPTFGDMKKTPLLFSVTNKLRKLNQPSSAISVRKRTQLDFRRKRNRFLTDLEELN
jgi:hypothetical protein